MWHLLIVLPAQFSETARGKGEVILEAGPAGIWLPERVFGTLVTFFTILKWEGKIQFFACRSSIFFFKYILKALCMLASFTGICMQYVA